MARKQTERTDAATPSTNGDNGRDDQGRFTVGNAGGPGNPNAAAVGAWRSTLARSVTPDDLQDVIGQLLKQAKDGEPWAIRELLNRCLGRPSQAVSIESNGLHWREMVAALKVAGEEPSDEDEDF